MYLERAEIALPDVSERRREFDAGTPSGSGVLPCPVTRGFPTRMTRASFRKMCGLNHERLNGNEDIARHLPCAACGGDEGRLPAELGFIELDECLAGYAGSLAARVLAI